MSDTVVDSSVVAKWILPEADSAEALVSATGRASLVRSARLLDQ